MIRVHATLIAPNSLTLEQRRIQLVTSPGRFQVRWSTGVGVTGRVSMTSWSV